jgi:hypothetical protein
MKLRIVSDGTRPGTNVFDEGGNRIEDVQMVRWRIGLGGLATADLRLNRVPVDVAGQAVGLMPEWGRRDPRSWLYACAEETAAADISEEDALTAVREGYSSHAADEMVKEDP